MAIIFAITGKAQTPLNEGFEATTFPPEDWTAITTSGTNQWSRNTSSPIIGTASAKCAYRSGGHISYLITPKLVVSANDTLKFFAAKSSSGTTNFRVCVSTTYQQDGLSSFDTINPLMQMLGDNMPTTLTQYNVDLSQFAGQEVYIAFQMTDYYGCHIFLDNVTGPNLFVPTCPKPRTLITSNPTTIGVDLGWTDPTGTIYNIQYMLNSETDWANATTISGVTNPYTFNTLTHSTYYKARVQRECTSEQSEWSTPITFTTACDVISAIPWTEGFENGLQSAALAPGNKPSPLCWYIIDSLNASSYYWQSNSTSHSGSKSIYMYGASYASSNTTSTYKNNEWLISPVIALTGNERLNFWSKKSSSSYNPDLLIYAMDVSQGDLDNTASNANFVYIGEIDTNILSTTYSEYEFNLSSLVGNYRLAFVRKKTASGSVYLDDVKVSAIPTCFPPTGITMSNITSDQAELNFTPAGSGDASWQVMLKNMTTNVTETDQINSLPHTFYNLTPNTIYNVTLMTDCGDGTFSDPTIPVTFRTNCVPATVPYFENFSTSVVVEPTCWTRKEGLLSDNSILTASTSGWSHSNTIDTAMRYNIDAATDKYWLITPSIDLGDGSLQYQVEFDVVLTAFTDAPANPPTYDSDDKFAVVVSTDNGITWLKTNATIWAEGDADSIRNFSNFGLSPTHVVVKLIDSLQIPYSGIIKIGFYGESTVSVSDNYLYIDNVAINEIPNCPAVFNTTASVDNFSTIRVNFATDNAESGTGWDIAYAETDPTSFDPTTATIVSVNDASELPYIITGLNAGSTYSVSVRQNCGGEWSPAVSSTIPNISSVVSLPYLQNFEDLNNISEWTLSNPDTNKWYISNAVSYPENTVNSLYISNTLGSTNDYAKTVISYAYASTIVDFGSGAAEYNLSFDWRARGESSSYDYMKVFLLPIDQAIPTTGWPVGQSIGGVFNQQSTWQHANIILPASEYENTVKKLVFIWWNDGSTGTDPSAAVDNIQILPKTCATPSNLVASTTDQTSVTLSWTENGTSTSWLVQYSINGIDWMSELASTNADFVLSNLNPSSTYQVRVYSLCSSIDTSSFVSNVFRTECGVISQFPWEEGFENTWVDAISPGNRIAPYCWININKGAGSTNYWSLTNSYYHTGIGSAQMYTDNSNQNNDWLITPQMTLTGNERVNFWAMNYSAISTEVDEISVWISDANLSIDTTNMGALGILPGFTQIFQTGIPVGPWLQYEVDLSQYSGNRYIAFVRRNTPDNGYYLRLDDVKVSALPNCRRVSNVALSNVSHEEATITWTPGQTTDASWNIYLTSGDTTITIPATQIPTTITNLLPNTNYSVVIRTNCVTEESDPTIPITFRTSCTPIAVPFLEEFTTSPLTNNCWEQHNGLLTDTVVFTSNTSSWAYNTTNPEASPITSMRLNIFGTSMKSWLITPTIDLGNTTNLYQLEFDVTNTDDVQMLLPGVLTGVDDKFAVVISTDNGLTWTTANAHIWSNETGATRVYNDLMSTTPIHIIIPLQDENLIPYQGLIKVGFYGESTVNNADNYLNIDNVAINEWADCQRPTGLAVNGVTYDEATISFTEQGTATSWEYSLGEVVDGVDNDPNAGAITSIFDNPHTIQGLTPSTDYFVAVRSDCMSPWSDIVTFRTSPLNVTSFPYLATFDESDPESSNWTSLSNSLNKWVVGDATSSSLGSSTDLSSAYISFNNGDSNSATTATTRAYFYRDFDFGSTPTTYDLSFDWKCLGTYNSSTNTVNSGIMVIPCEITDSINLGGLPLNQNQRVIMVHSQTDWQNATTQLDNMSGVKRLIFYTWGGYTSTNRYNPAAIDNISLTQATCARPTDVTISDINPTSALISWNGSASNYIVTYRSAEDATDTYVNVTGNSTTLSNLSSGTKYYVWVKSVCGSENSINSPSQTFMTPCVPITALPWTNGFESISAAGEFPSCFATQGVSGKLSSAISTQSYNRSARTDSNYAYFAWSAWNRLYTPEFDLVAGGNYTFSFWYKADGDSGWEELSAGLYSTQGDTTSFVSAIGTPITSGVTNTAYQQYTGTFTVSTSGIYSIGIFVKANSNPWYLSIDDLSLESDNTCTAPTSLASNNVSPTSANITWTPTGTETAWQVRIGETATPIDVNSASYAMNNLTANTSYTVYVRANCGTSYSNWISYTFTTLANIPTTVVTSPATLVAQTTATLNGTITAGTEAITAQGFEWKEASATTWNTVNASGTTILYNLTGLTAATAYEFKAFATIASGPVYGTTETFNTLAQGVTPPTVATTAANQIAQTTATLNGTITAGTEAITAQGFEWKETSATTWNTVNAAGTTISYNLTGLTASTAYEFRAFATTASGPAYGTTENFTTLANVAPVVTTDSIANLEGRTVTLYGTITLGSETLTAQGFEWKATSEASWTNVNGTLTGDVLSYDLTELTPNTAYEFRAYATTASGTINGTTVNFSTLGLNEVNGNEMSIMMYPNPTSNQANLIVNGVNGDAKIIVSDMQGRILSTTNVKSSNGVIEHIIDVKDLAKGVYYVRIQNNQLSKTQKLIVK
ncbi:MAG: repeat-containing protein [Bacteroidetes bacterium]|nr:repeat-containing protein [Bacteroidota bacterium]